LQHHDLQCTIYHELQHEVRCVVACHCCGAHLFRPSQLSIVTIVGCHVVGQCSQYSIYIIVDICLTFLGFLLDVCLTFIGLSSDVRQIFVRLSSDIHWTFIWFSSNVRRIFVKLSLHIHLTSIWL
jgi:hypothetical protein